MEVRVGYKQTEAGCIPLDWLENTVGELIEFEGGSQPDKRVFSPTIKPGYVRLIQIRDYKSDKFKTYVPRLLARRFCTEKDIMIGRYGPPIFQILRGLAGAYNVALIKAKPHENIHQNFAYYFLTQEKLFTFIEKLSQRSSGQTGVDLKELRAYPFPLPPTKAEQEAIAEALSDADAHIESLEQLIAKKRQIKQGAMQELLTGKRRLPGFRGEWKVSSLFDIAGARKELFDDGDWIESEHITDEGIRLVQTGNIGIGCFQEKKDKKYIYESSFLSLACKELRLGDLLICRLADPAGRACVLPDIGEETMVTSVDVTIFRPPESVANRIFLANVFSSEHWFREVSERSGGTTHKRISRGALGKIKIRLPHIEEQTAIATILSDMDAEITVLEVKLAKARQVKQGMMQELLTGQIRLV